MPLCKTTIRKPPVAGRALLPAVLAAVAIRSCGLQLNCGGAMVLNALLSNNASAGGGAYINTVTGLTLNLNEWTGNTADTGSGGLDLQTVQEASITNDTFAK